MTYSVKEIYFTLQGEGAQTGRPAVFLRFAGCNLWSGREQDRAGAVCNFCDTEFVGTDGPGGGKFDSAEALAAAVRRMVSPVSVARYTLMLTIFLMTIAPINCDTIAKTSIFLPKGSSNSSMQYS